MHKLFFFNSTNNLKFSSITLKVTLFQVHKKFYILLIIVKNQRGLSYF